MKYWFLSLTLLCFCFFKRFSGVFGIEALIDIVSIVDSKSLPASLIAIHSVVASTSNKIRWNVLMMPSNSTVAAQSLLMSLSSACFPSVTLHTAIWKAPLSLLKLSNHQFDQEHIYARFYLPQAFPHLTRFIYLDNDVVTNADLTPLMTLPMIIGKALPIMKQKYSSTQAGSSLKGREGGRGGHTRQLQSTTTVNNNNAATSTSKAATVAFVIEKHHFYRQYITDHFRHQHPLVQPAVVALGEDTFLNAGVFVVDAVLWRRQNMTASIEKLLADNTVAGDGKSSISNVSQNYAYKIFNSQAVGDQGPFFLLFAQSLAFLPPQYNMRRLPRKSIHMLEQGHTGIVHFAGLTHGDPFLLCQYPLMVDMLLPAALPLYLAALLSLAKSCPTADRQFGLLNKCKVAVGVVADYHKKYRVIVKYDGGRGKLSWPPPMS